MLTIASHLDVMNRLGRAMADPTRSRILMTLLSGPSYPAVLSRELELTRSNVSNHLTCLRESTAGWLGLSSRDIRMRERVGSAMARPSRFMTSRREAMVSMH